MLLPPDTMPYANVDARALYEVKVRFHSWRRQARLQRQLATGVEDAIRRVLGAIETALHAPPDDQVAWNFAVAQLRAEVGFIDWMGGDHPEFHAFTAQQKSFLAERGVL